jgi:hypothetical protein
MKVVGGSLLLGPTKPVVWGHCCWFGTTKGWWTGPLLVLDPVSRAWVVM